MAEGSATQVGSTASARGETHLSRGAGPEEEGGAGHISEYCKELLTRGREELSLEELRAERYFQLRQREMEERLQQLKEVKEQLNQELEEKTRLLLLRTSQQQVVQKTPASPTRDSGRPPPAASFQIFDESLSAAARPAGNSEPPDDVFLRPDETGLCLKVQCPLPGGVGPSGLSQTNVLAEDIQANVLRTLSSADPPVGTTEDLKSLADSHPPSVPQRPVCSTTEKLSPIQETSVETSSLTSLGGLSAGNCSPLDQEDQDRPAPGPVGGPTDPCDPEVRRRLLDLCDVTSCPSFQVESRPLPTVCGCLQLGGDVYHIYSTVVDGGSFSVYKGATEDDYVLIKVDRCRLPWDFHQFSRLKRISSQTAARGLPLISCFLFLDGCVTVYTSPPDHMFAELTECEDSVARKAAVLLQLVSELHSCGLLHAALQPNLLACSYGSRGFVNPEWVFPVDWSSSVDLDLQPDITSVQHLPSAQTYISLGLLEPTNPPQLVDLVGVAETVHLLLTDRRMVPVKDDAGWIPEGISRDQHRWTTFFRSLLNAGGRSSLSVLSELKQQLSTL